MGASGIFEVGVYGTVSVFDCSICSSLEADFKFTIDFEDLMDVTVPSGFNVLLGVFGVFGMESTPSDLWLCSKMTSGQQGSVFL